MFVTNSVDLQGPAICLMCCMLLCCSLCSHCTCSMLHGCWLEKHMHASPASGMLIGLCSLHVDPGYQLIFFIRLGGHPTELMRAGYWPLLPPSFHIAPWLPIGWGTITLTPCAGGCAIFDDFGKNQTQTNSSSRFFQFANKTYICHPATQNTFATQTIFLIFGFDIGVPPMVFKSHDSIISFTQIIQKKEKTITQETFSKQFKYHQQIMCMYRMQCCIQ